MGVELIRLKLNEREGDVRAVVGHALKVAEQIVEHKALRERAVSLLQAFNVIELHRVDQYVDPLLERFDAIGSVHVLLHKAGDGDVQNAAQRGGQYRKFAAGLTGKDDLLLMPLAGGLGDVHGVVADTLEVGKRVQVFGDSLVLFTVELVGAKLYQIGTELVLVEVDHVLGLFHLASPVFGELVQELQGEQQIVPGARPPPP